MDRSRFSEADRIALAANLLRDFGELRFRALGASMIPSIFPGDVLIVKREPLAETQAGHIVLFYREDRFWAHRVMRIESRGGHGVLITRGDALIDEDPVVSPAEFLGRVSMVVREGLPFKPSATETLGDSLLGYAVQHSDFVARCLLRWHDWRTRLLRQLPASKNRSEARCP